MNRPTIYLCEIGKALSNNKSIEVEEYFYDENDAIKYGQEWLDDNNNTDLTINVKKVPSGDIEWIRCRNNPECAGW